jgi:hypothetical protein
MLTLARILLTITVLGYGFATLKVDLNKTHASNPTWTPHARFHVVWQILSYTGIGLISLYLIWVDSATSIKSLYLAAAINVAIYARIFTSVFARPLFWRRTIRRERLSAISAAFRPKALALGRKRDCFHRDVSDLGVSYCPAYC